MNDNAAVSAEPKISREFAARYDAGVRRLGADLGIPEAQIRSALEFTGAVTPECLRPEELENLRGLNPARREHIRACTVCRQIEQAMNAEASDAQVSDFLSLLEDDACPTCGRMPTAQGLDEFLGKLGITEDMVVNLKSHFQTADVDEYLATARDYLKQSGTKAESYAKEHPGRVAAGVATLALGAGLLYAALRED